MNEVSRQQIIEALADDRGISQGEARLEVEVVWPEEI
jgi:hypothetical protein